MVENTSVSKLLLDLIPVANSAVSEDEVVKHFLKVVSKEFGIDSVNLNNIYKTEYQVAGLPGYIVNTKKPYVDNQLSEYSSFPELINYKNQNYKSCAIVPIIVDGRVVSLLEMLSNIENKFTNELLDTIAFSASFIGLAIMYKYENGKNVRIANYFNGAFSSSIPQLLVSSNDYIVKSNKAANREFDLISASSKNIKEILGMDFAQLKSLIDGRSKNLTFEKAKQRRVYSISSSLINDKLIHLNIQDVTELERFKALLESLNSNSYSGVVFLDSEFNIIDATQNIERVTGYQNSILLGKKFTDIIVESERKDFINSITTQKDGKSVAGYTNLFKENSIPVLIHFVVSKWPNGYILVFTNADAEKYIKDIKSALSDFINGTSDIIIMIDNLGYIRECNMPAESFLGYPRNELIGKDIKSLYSDPSILDRDIAYARNGGKVDSSYIDLVTKSRSNSLSATHSIRALKGIDNETNYIIVIKELETKRKLRDQENQIKNLSGDVKKLRSMGDLKSQFIYNISHELKTPLTNINGFSKLLLDEQFGTINEEQKDNITTIIDEANRLMLIIQQVLDAAKLDSDKVKLELKEVDLKELENNPSIKALQEAASNKGLSFSWEVGYDVPKVMADPNRLIQAFVNLIGNSIKFTESGSIKVKISKKNKRSVECSVEDTGIGISEEDQHRLFKKFYQAPKRGLVKQDGAGTGLGLSITRDIIKLHRGKIGIKSEVGKGSRFWFTLPVNPRTRKKDQIQ